MMSNKVAALMMLAGCASPVAAQPVWRLDVAGADSGLVLFSDSQATAFGNPFCSARDYQPLVVSADKLGPSFSFESESFDFGASAVSAPRAVGVGIGTTDANSTAVIGIRGLGTQQVVIYFRAATQHATTQTACSYRAAGHAEINAAIPIEIANGPSGAAYRISYQWEFSASAATPYEAVSPNWPEDGIICSGGADLTCPIDASAPLFTGAYITGYFPDRTSAPLTGTGELVVSPGWSGSGVYPDRLPILFAGVGAVVDDVMTNPTPSGQLDSCAGDFTGRSTLTIGATMPTGACCRRSDCLLTTQQACLSSFSGTFRGNGSACTSAANQLNICCPANVNGSGGVSVQDIFDFLNWYFSSAPQGDFNASGTVSVQDIFDFLAAYFAGC